MQVIYSSWKHRNRGMSNDRWSERKVMARSKKPVRFTLSFTLIHQRSGCAWTSSERWRRFQYAKMKDAYRGTAWTKVRAHHQGTQSNRRLVRTKSTERETARESGRRRAWEAITACPGDRFYLLGKQEVPGGFQQGGDRTGSATLWDGPNGWQSKDAHEGIHGGGWGHILGMIWKRYELDSRQWNEHEGCDASSEVKEEQTGLTWPLNVLVCSGKGRVHNHGYFESERIRDDIMSRKR